MNKVFIAAVAVVLMLSACSDSSDKVAVEESSRKRQEIERKEQEEATRQPVPLEVELEAEEPKDTTPAEPEYKEITVWRFDGTNCLSYEQAQCGVSFWECDNNKVYECMHNVTYTATTKKVLVE